MALPLTHHKPPPSSKIGKDLTAPFVIAAVVLIIFILFWIGFMHGIEKTPPVSQVFFQCARGQCATNIYNGEKRCPQNEQESVIYNAGFETCNSRFTCESILTPYALLANGGVNELGVCETGTICRCLRKPQCPIETMVVFTMTNGSIYLQDASTSRTLFVQTPLAYQGDTGAPFTFDDTNTQFCAIKAIHLNRVAPGACVFANSLAPTTNEVVSCMQRNPCLTGVMAFAPTNRDAISSVPVACVPGLRNSDGSGPCVGTQVAVWNTQLGTLSCFDTSA
jgi:hypothetical protein